ncbi:MAG: transglycosylase domain-containing protein [Acidimicrobiales bacterium]
MTSIQQVIDPLSGPSNPRNRRRNPFWRFRRFFFVLALLAVVGAGSVLYAFSRTDLPADNFDQLAQTSYVCTAEVSQDCGPDNATASFSAAGEDRELITYDQLPPQLINAVVATEDQHFFTHRGVDPQGIVRAAYRYTRQQGVMQGGSTITQQYVKLAFDDQEDTLTRKAREVTRAVKLEQELAQVCASTPATQGMDPQQCAKHEILTRYLNRAYFGRGAAGVQAAAQAYFSKDVGQLTAAESAFLAGLLRNPNGADPETNLPEAERRRNVGLDLMAEQGYLTPEEAEAAKAEPWAVRPRQNREGLGEVRGSEFGSEYFVEEVRLELDRIYPNGQIYSSGLRVYTTLDQNLQQAAYNAAHAPKPDENLNERGLPELGPTYLDPNNPDDPAAALVSLDRDGRVVAMLGGTNFQETEFNLATSSGGEGRQPGSTFKVFALATAIDQDISPRSQYPAARGVAEIGGACADGSGRPWRVSGGGTNSGHRDLIDALTWSSNVVFAELVVDIGPDQMADTAHRLGITSPLGVAGADGQIVTPCSAVLGSQGAPVIDMASAFSTLWRAGIRQDPVLIERVEDSNGNVICWYPKNGVCAPDSARPGQQAIDPDVARQVNYVMTQVTAKGTGRSAPWSRDQPVAGKTGTSQQERDAWFAGFSCDYTTVVWVGYPDEKPMIDFRRPLPDGSTGFATDGNGDPIDSRGWPNVQGGNLPTWIWQAYMEAATADKPPCEGLDVSDDFTGSVRNSELTTASLPPCGVLLDDNGQPVGDTPADFQPSASGAQTDCVPLDQWIAAHSPPATSPAGPTTSMPDESGDSTTTADPDAETTTTTTDPNDGSTTVTTDPDFPVPTPVFPSTTINPGPPDNGAGNGRGGGRNGGGVPGVPPNTGG